MSGLLATVWEKATDTVAAYSLPELEVKVREATNSDHWGPTGPQMKELARATAYYQDMHTVMSALWKRIAERDKNWRFAYKSLLCIDYILRNGSEQVIPECRRHSYDIQALMSFNLIDEEGKDVGVNVRERAKHVFELLSDDSRLRDERDRAQKNAGKFDTAISSESYGGGGGYGGYGGGGGGGYGGDRYAGSSGRSSDNYGGYPGRTAERRTEPEPRRAATAAPRAPPDEEEEEAPKPPHASSSKPAAPKVVIAPVGATSAPVVGKQPANIFDMDFPAPVNSNAAPTSFFPPSAQSQQQSFFPAAPPAQDDFFNPRSGNAKPAAPSSAVPTDAFGDFVVAPTAPAPAPVAPQPKDDDPWAHAALFKGLSHKPEAKAPAAAVPKATLGQLSKAAPATVPTMPTYTAQTYAAVPTYPMGTQMMGYVPAGSYAMPTSYGAPGNPALR